MIAHLNCSEIMALVDRLKEDLSNRVFHGKPEGSNEIQLRLKGKAGIVKWIHDRNKEVLFREEEGETPILKFRGVTAFSVQFFPETSGALYRIEFGNDCLRGYVFLKQNE